MFGRRNPLVVRLVHHDRLRVARLREIAAAGRCTCSQIAWKPSMLRLPGTSSLRLVDAALERAGLAQLRHAGVDLLCARDSRCRSAPPNCSTMVMAVASLVCGP